MSATIKNKRFLAQQNLPTTYTTEITGQVARESEKALLFVQSIEVAGQKLKRKTWLPKSQIISSKELRGGLVQITIPDWLANEKGTCS